jgi:hypothetical protein
MTIAENFGVDKSPTGLSRIILEVLRDQFKTNSKHFIYKEPATTDSLAIENSTAYTRGMVGMRPGIFIKRGPVLFNKIAIGDKSMGGHRSDGTVEYQLELTGSHTIFCLSRTEGECEKLGEEASDVLIAFKPVIRRTFDFHRFEVASIGELGILEEESEIFAVPILVNYHFSSEWQLKQESLKLKLSLLAEPKS